MKTKKKVRLTESDLHKIISKSVKKILNEGTESELQLNLIKDFEPLIDYLDEKYSYYSELADNGGGDEELDTFLMHMSDFMGSVQEYIWYLQGKRKKPRW